MKSLKNTVAAVVASTALVSGLANAQQIEPDYTDAEKKTIELVNAFNECGQGEMNKITQTDFDARVDALRQQYKTDIIIAREQIEKQNPGMWRRNKVRDQD